MSYHPAGMGRAGNARIKSSEGRRGLSRLLVFDVPRDWGGPGLWGRDPFLSFVPKRALFLPAIKRYEGASVCSAAKEIVLPAKENILSFLPLPLLRLLLYLPDPAHKAFGIVLFRDTCPLSFQPPVGASSGAGGQPNAGAVFFLFDGTCRIEIRSQPIRTVRGGQGVPGIVSGQA